MTEAASGAEAVARVRRVATLPVEPDDGWGFSRGDLLWLPEQLNTVTKFCFTIPHKAPSLNELNVLRAQDAHQQGNKGYNDFKTGWERVIRHCWVMSAKQFGQEPPRIVGGFKANYLYVCADRRSDPSNMHAATEKFVLDALVAVGALPGDGFKWHKDGSTYRCEHADRWGIFVTLEQTEAPAKLDKRKAVGRSRTRRRRSKT
jgi:hypothetical protein